MPESQKSMYSYFVDMDSGNFLLWDLLVPTTRSLIEKGAVITVGETLGVGNLEHKERKTKDEGIVPTVDTVRYMFLSTLLLFNKNPVLLTGKFLLFCSVVQVAQRQQCKQSANEIKVSALSSHVVLLSFCVSVGMCLQQEKQELERLLLSSTC